MKQLGEHINYINQNIHAFDQISKIVFYLGSKKGVINDEYSPKLTDIYTYLSISIVDTPEKDISYYKKM